MKAKHAIWGYLIATIIIPTLGVVVPLFKVSYWPGYEAVFLLASTVKFLAVGWLVVKVMRHRQFKEFLDR